jgi:aldehyde:ferredoxin oxidoreductase
MIAAAMDWYDLGLITEKDTGGVDLRWGNYWAIIEMIHKIARREGFGDVLAEGPLRAAEKVGPGAEDCISHAKGSQFANEDSYKFNRAALLGAATSTRGGDHLRGSLNYFGERMPDKSKYKGPKIGNLGSYEDQAGPVYYIQTLNTLADALEVCKFVTARSMQEMGLTEMANLYSAATGVTIDEEELRRIADRIWSVERAFLVREGITRKDDAVYGRVTSDPVSSGPHKGLAHDQKKYDKMLDEYYDLVGWDKKTGVPTREKLESLGLKDIADELARIGKF